MVLDANEAIEDIGLTILGICAIIIIFKIFKSE